jgi:hypothetical protein
VSRRSRTLSPAVAIFALLALAASPALAKEGAEAKLDTAIPRDAEPGSMVDVGWSVFSTFDDGRLEPIHGSPVYIKLVAPDGKASTEVAGTEKPTGSGHYTASIEVPAGGIGEVIVGMVGEACTAGGVCERSDILFPLTNDPLVSGAAPAVAPVSTTPIGTLLLPLVAIGTAVAVAGALAALLLGRRRTFSPDPAGR